MQACTYTNCFAGTALAVALAFAGCQSSSAAKPAESAPSEAASAEPASSESSSERASAAPSHSPNSEKWEGETEATSAPAPKAGTETRTTEAIRQVIIDHRKPFRDCYEKAVKELPSLRGTMTLHFVLDPEGKIKQADLNVERSDLKSPQVADCSIAILKSLKFPESSRGMDTTVNYPFDFKN